MSYHKIQIQTRYCVVCTSKNCDFTTELLTSAGEAEEKCREHIEDGSDVNLVSCYNHTLEIHSVTVVGRNL